MRTSMPVDQDRAAVHIVEAGEQVGDGGLAGAGWSDQGDHLPGFGVQADVLQAPARPPGS